MKLPQHDQKLELWPGDCYALAMTLAQWVRNRQLTSELGAYVARSDALMFKPATRLSLRLLRLHNTDHAMRRRKARLVRVEYDELLALNFIVRMDGITADHYDPARLIGHIDQKSLSLTPYFTR